MPAEHEEKVSLLRKEVSVLNALLGKKETELEDSRQTVRLKGVEIEEMKKLPTGM